MISHKLMPSKTFSFKTIGFFFSLDRTKLNKKEKIKLHSKREFGGPCVIGF